VKDVDDASVVEVRVDEVVADDWLDVNELLLND